MNYYEFLVLYLRIMDISDLHIFRTVVEAGGVTRAAERLHRVPSNVTTRIRQLEAELGATLFLRGGKRMTISPAGQVLLGYAESILALVEQAREALLDPAPRGLFQIGSMESTAAIRLPQLLAEYHHRYPEVKLELSTGPSAPLLARVLAGELSAAFVADNVADERLISVEAFIEELVIVASASQANIQSPDDVSHSSMLTFATGCAYRRRFEDWFRSGGIIPERVVELTSYHAILGCAVAGMGVALMPRAMLDIFPERAKLSIHELPVSQRHTSTSLVWRKDLQQSSMTAMAELLAAKHRTDQSSTGLP